MHLADACSISGSSIVDVETAALIPMIRPSMLWRPEREAPSAWIEHVPFAFWLVDVLRPRRVVELGTHTGVSYSALCQAVKTLDLPTSCFAVDTWSGDCHAGFYDESIYQEFAAFHDSRYGAFSTLIRSRFDDALHHFEDGTIDLLHIDGLHTYEAVRHDFESWLQKLSMNAVVLFHDTNVRDRNFGVFRLWKEITGDRPHFEFLHGYGLGVLGMGHDYPDALDRLFRATSDHRVLDEVRRTFMTLGELTTVLRPQKGTSQPGVPHSTTKTLQPPRLLALDVRSVLSMLRRALPARPGTPMLGLRDMLRHWIRANKVGKIAKALARRLPGISALVLQRDLLLKENATLRRRLLSHLMEKMSPPVAGVEPCAGYRFWTGTDIVDAPMPAATGCSATSGDAQGPTDQLLLIDLGAKSLKIGRAGG